MDTMRPLLTETAHRLPVPRGQDGWDRMGELEVE